MSTIAIDLGTSNTQIACLDANGVPKNIGEAIPTALFVDKDSGRIRVGAEAQLAYEDAQSAGQTDADSYYLETFKPELCMREVDGAAHTVLLGESGRRMTWLEVLTECFRHCRAYAQRVEFAGEEVNSVVLTHPVNFPNSELYRQAAEAAGFRSVRFVQEPEAAYLGYRSGGRDLGNNVLVFDMGGGTLDVALLQQAADGRRVNTAPLRLDTAGVHIDNAVCASMYEELLAKGIANACGEVEVAFKKYARTQIKEELGIGGRSSVKIRYMSDVSDTVLRGEYTMERFRKVLDRLMTTVYRRIDEYVRRLPVQPDTVLMVGGSSRLRLIQEALKNLFPGINVFTPHDGGSLVAKGALLSTPTVARNSDSSSKTMDTWGIMRKNVGGVGEWEWRLTLTSASYDLTARITDIASGRELLRVKHSSFINDIAHSPCGRYLATASSDKTARITEIATGRELMRVQHASCVTSVDFSPCGQYLATGSKDKTACITEVATGRELLRIQHADWIQFVKYSPGGRYLITSSDDNKVRITEPSTGREILRVQHTDKVNSVECSPCGRYLATGSNDGTARITEIATGRELLRIQHKGWVLSVAFSACGCYLATSSSDKTVRITEIATGKEVVKKTHSDVVRTVTFHPGERKPLLATGSEDGSVNILTKLFNPWLSSHITVSRPCLKHSQVVHTIAFSPCGRYLATGSNDGTARITEFDTGREMRRVQHEAPISSVAFAPVVRMGELRECPDDSECPDFFLSGIIDKLSDFLK